MEVGVDYKAVPGVYCDGLCGGWGQTEIEKVP
jgi:hypothetical protein